MKRTREGGSQYMGGDKAVRRETCSTWIPPPRAVPVADNGSAQAAYVDEAGMVRSGTLLLLCSSS
jgi:hypothetical protein